MKNLYIILWIVGITFYFIDSNKFNYANIILINKESKG